MENTITPSQKFLDQDLSITAFKNTKDPKGLEISLSGKKYLKSLSKCFLSEEKENVPLVAPCRLKDNYRLNDNVIDVNQLVFDIDDPQGEVLW